MFCVILAWKQILWLTPKNTDFGQSHLLPSQPWKLAALQSGVDAGVLSDSDVALAEAHATDALTIWLQEKWLTMRSVRPISSSSSFLRLSKWASIRLCSSVKSFSMRLRWMSWDVGWTDFTSFTVVYLVKVFYLLVKRKCVLSSVCVLTGHWTMTLVLHC